MTEEEYKEYQKSKYDYITEYPHRTRFQIGKNNLVYRYEFTDEFGHLWYFFESPGQDGIAVAHSPECSKCKEENTNRFQEELSALKQSSYTTTESSYSSIYGW